jgi:hypothetical protein
MLNTTSGMSGIDGYSIGYIVSPLPGFPDSSHLSYGCAAPIPKVSRPFRASRTHLIYRMDGLHRSLKYFFLLV